MRAFFYDADFTEHFVYVDGRATYPGDVDPDLLNAPVCTTEFIAAFTRAGPKFDRYSAASDAIIPWFARCCCDAGGGSFDRRAWIGDHDVQSRFDLVSQVWLTDP